MKRGQRGMAREAFQIECLVETRHHTLDRAPHRKLVEGLRLGLHNARSSLVAERLLDAGSAFEPESQTATATTGRDGTNFSPARRSSA
jgi:hypothetical protein